MLIAGLVLVAPLLALKAWSRAVTETTPDQLVTASAETKPESDTLIALVHGMGGPGPLEEVRQHLLWRKADWTRLDLRGDEPKGREPPTGPEKAAGLLTLNYGTAS
jgi:hypothetical protein